MFTCYFINISDLATTIHSGCAFGVVYQLKKASVGAGTAIPFVGVEERNYYNAKGRHVVIKQLVEEHVTFVNKSYESAF